MALSIPMTTTVAWAEPPEVLFVIDPATVQPRGALGLGGALDLADPTRAPFALQLGVTDVLQLSVERATAWLADDATAVDDRTVLAADVGAARGPLNVRAGVTCTPAGPCGLRAAAALSAGVLTLHGTAELGDGRAAVIAVAVRAPAVTPVFEAAHDAEGAHVAGGVRVGAAGLVQVGAALVLGDGAPAVVLRVAGEVPLP